MEVVVAILALAVVSFWISQVVTLMRMPEDAFPGRFDKPLWAATLIVTFVLGAIVFFVWQVCERADNTSKTMPSNLADLISRSDGPHRPG